MRISIIVAHPNQGSFNHAIADAACRVLVEAGHRVKFHDLYMEDFEPLLPYEEFNKDAEIAPEIESHCYEISKAEGIIIIHPNWWGQPPAILKGWVDRVIRPGVAYEFLEGDGGEGVPKGLLQAKAAIVFNTANTPIQREKDVFGDPLETIWKNCIFGLCGISVFHRRVFEVVVTSTAEQRRAWLDEVGRTVMDYFPRFQ